MKTLNRILSSTLIVLLFFLVLRQNDPLPAPAGQRGPAGQTVPAGSGDDALQRTVSQPVVPSLSPPVRDLPAATPDLSLKGEWNPRHNPLLLQGPVPPDVGGALDPLLAHSSNGGNSTPPLLFDFEGLNSSQGGGAVPPDTIGDIGPGHYVQMVNVAFAIFDRSGNMIAGPTPFNALFAGAGGPCEANNWGDPVVLYDALADRWLMSQFASGNTQCVAISQTGDPTGSFWLYQFGLPQFPDYFKFGVWPDAYYMGANEGSYTAYAFDRPQMLNGDAATYIRFAGGTNFYLPADLDGATPPPDGAPNPFYTFKDNVFHGGNDRLEVWAFHADFANPGNATFTLANSINIASYTYTVCGFFNLSCIPQVETTRKLDAVSEWPMWRLQYRRFGTYETLVSNFAVDVDGTDHAGIRWFELRQSGGGGWSLYQEGTHAPDSHSRFMGSMAMDGAGNIALGYSVSSSSMHPAIRYTIRTPGDPLGTLQDEASLIEGGGSQTGSNRWGDYSSLNVDPVDDCTFWYTNEYYSSNASSSWHTRVGVFKVEGCGSPAAEADLALLKTDSADPVLLGQVLTYTLQVENNGPLTATNVVVTDVLPASVTFLEAPGCNQAAGTVTCNLSSLPVLESASFTIATLPTVATTLTNTASAAASETDPLPDNNSASETTQVNEPLLQADLALSKSVAPPSLLLNEWLTYTLTITNTGPDTATAVVVSDTLPAEVAFLSAPGCSESGGLVTCALGSLNNGQTAGVTIVAQAMLSGTASNTASVSAAELDPNPANNSDSAEATIEESPLPPTADLALAKWAEAEEVYVGRPLTYTLVISNFGPDTASAATLTDTLPAGVGWIGAQSSQGSCLWDAGTVVCTLGDVPAGQAVTVTLAITAPTDAGTLQNSAAVSAAELDPLPGNNSAGSSVVVKSWLLYLPRLERP